MPSKKTTSMPTKLSNQAQIQTINSKPNSTSRRQNFLKNESLVVEPEFTSGEMTRLETKFDSRSNLNGQKKHGILAITGAPNAGKSTLVNALLGQKLAIVSPKVQTTRNSLRAILTEEENQLIIIDTPGIFIPKNDRILERIIVKSAWQALREAGHICFLIDATIGLDEENRRILCELKAEMMPLTVIITKIDLVKKSKILTIIASTSELGITDIMPISAANNDGIELLRKFLCQTCQNQGWIYDENEITDASSRYLVSEITREKLFLNLEQELPYSVSVKTDSFEMLDHNELKIMQTIFVLKETQKSIILGKKGAMIKKIGQEARLDIRELLNKKVHLFLFVKVQGDWMRDIENFEKIDLKKLPNSNEKIVKKSKK